MSPGLTLIESGRASSVRFSLQFELETSRVSFFGGLSRLFGGGCDALTALLPEPSTIEELDSTGLIGNVELADDGGMLDWLMENGMVTARASGIPSTGLRRLELRSFIFNLSPNVPVDGDGDGDIVYAANVPTGDGRSCSGLSIVDKLEGGPRDGGGRTWDSPKMALDFLRVLSFRLRARLTPTAASVALLAEKDENSENMGPSSSLNVASAGAGIIGASSTRLAGLVPRPNPER